MNSLLRTASVLSLASFALAAHAVTYSGNGGTGFGGGVGNSVLTVTSTSTAINFSLNTSGFGGNALAIYLDTKVGGVNDNSTFTDTADGGRTALSGLSGNGRALVTFAPGFGADYGISVEPGVFAGIFDLSTPGNFGFVASAGLDPAATSVLDFSVNRADVGLSATDGFTFEASLISTTAYRSNETIGTSVTLVDPTNPGTAPNAGFTGTQTFSTVNTFAPQAVPEPAPLAALALGGLALARRRRA